MWREWRARCCKSFLTGARSAITGTFAFGPDIAITWNELRNLAALEMQTESQRWLSFAGVAVEGGSGAAVLLVLVGDSVGVEGCHADGDYPPLGMAVVALLFGFLPKIT